MSLRALLNLLMPAFYIVVGFLLCVTNFLSYTIAQYRFGLGALFLGYGGLRAVMFFRKRHQQDATTLTDDLP